MRRRKGKRRKNVSYFDYIGDAVHETILRKLPAVSFAAADCVSKSWHRLCHDILFSRPKLASALALRPWSPVSASFSIFARLPFITLLTISQTALEEALEEALNKVLSQPIRPHFALVHITGYPINFDFILDYVAIKVGRKTPIIMTRSSGVMGRDAHSNQHLTLQIPYNNGHETLSYNVCVLMAIGFLPSVKVTIIPIREVHLSPSKLTEQRRSKILPSFVDDIQKFSLIVSGSSSPSFIMMFGNKYSNIKPIIDELDKEMSPGTIIAGNESCDIFYCCPSYTEEEPPGNAIAVSLVFANDIRRPADVGEVRFHGGVSRGLAPIGRLYRVVNVRFPPFQQVTGREDGSTEVLSGNEMVWEIENLLGIKNIPFLFVGVTIKENGDSATAGSSSHDLHETSSVHPMAVGGPPVDFFVSVRGNDNRHLLVDGLSMFAGDYFQFFFPAACVTLSAVEEVTNMFRSLKERWKSERVEFVGGFVFSSYLREFFLFTTNFDSSPFLENFEDAPVVGVGCSGEVARCLSNKPYINQFSSVYVGLSYSLPPLPSTVFRKF